MAISPLNQATAAWSSGASINISVTSTTAGNLLTLCFASGTTVSLTGGATVSSVSGGGTWTQAVAKSQTNLTAKSDLEIWYCQNNSGGITTVTVNISGTGNPATFMSVVEWSGIGPSISVDTTNSIAANAFTDTLSLTTNQATDLIIQASSTASVSTNYSSGPTGSFIALNSANVQWTNSAYEAPGTTGTFSCAWAYTGSTPEVYVGVAAAFFTQAQPKTSQQQLMMMGVGH